MVTFTEEILNGKLNFLCKFGMNVLNEILLDPANCQDYSFYRLSVIKGKQAGGRVGGKLNYFMSRPMFHKILCRDNSL